MPPKPPILPPGVAGPKGKARRGIGQLTADVKPRTPSFPRFPVGNSTVVQHTFQGAPSSTNLLSTADIVTQPGSLLLIEVSRGDEANLVTTNQEKPTDSLNNIYTLVGPKNNFTGGSTSGINSYVCRSGVGGTVHANAWIEGGYGAGSDEVTITFVEILSTFGPGAIITNNVFSGNTLTNTDTSTITLAGPGKIIAFVHGLGAQGTTHPISSLNFTKIPSASAEGDPDPTLGYIQVSVFEREVNAGTYSGRFISTTGEAMDILLVAIQAAPLVCEPTEDQQLVPRPSPAEVNRSALTLITDVSTDFPIAATASIPDEDFWATAPPAVNSTLFQRLPLSDDDVPAGVLFGQPDEDFWITYPAASQAQLYKQLPLLDDDVPGALFGQPDEDFWVSGVPPTAASVTQKLPFLDPEELPAGVLFGQPDEDFWTTYQPASPASLYVRLPLADDDVPAGSLTGQPDYDFAWPPQMPAAVVATLGLLYLPDATDVPAGTLYGQPDEDLNALYPAPIVARNFLRLPSLDPDEVPAANLFGQYDEDLWVTSAAPAQAQVYQRLPLVLDPTDEIVSTPIVFWTDEDLWTIYPLPVTATTRTAASALVDDIDDVPAGFLRGQYDEDFWALAPTQTTIIWTPILLGVDDNYAPALSASDEGWVLALPWAVPQSMLVSIADTSDEDAYIAPPPVLAEDDPGWSVFPRFVVPTSYRAPFAPDDVFPPPPYVVEELFWSNKPAPTPARMYQPMPYAYDEAAYSSGLIVMMPTGLHSDLVIASERTSLSTVNAASSAVATAEKSTLVATSEKSDLTCTNEVSSLTVRLIVP